MLPPNMRYVYLPQPAWICQTCVFIVLVAVPNVICQTFSEEWTWFVNYMSLLTFSFVTVPTVVSLTVIDLSL